MRTVPTPPVSLIMLSAFLREENRCSHDKTDGLKNTSRVKKKEKVTRGANVGFLLDLAEINGGG